MEVACGDEICGETTNFRPCVRGEAGFVGVAGEDFRGEQRVWADFTLTTKQMIPMKRRAGVSMSVMRGLSSVAPRRIFGRLSPARGNSVLERASCG